MKLDTYLATVGITDAIFASRVGVDRTTISRLRNGKVRPDWKTLDAIVAVTDGAVTPNDFLTAADPSDTDPLGKDVSPKPDAEAGQRIGQQTVKGAAA